MSRFVVTKRQRVPYRSAHSDVGDMLPPQCIPLNTLIHEHADVAYEGPAVLERPEGTQITIQNRSGDRKKY